MSEVKFKETELGFIPDEWGLAKIDDLKSNKRSAIAMGPFGSNITKDNFIESGVPVIRGGNIGDFEFIEKDFVYLSEEKANELKASNAFPKDLVLTHRGTLGQVGIIPENPKYSRYVVSQSQMKLTCDEKKINPFYLFYFLKSAMGQHLFLMNSSQTGVPAIARPTSSLKEIKVPLPSLSEQNSIVNILRSIDKKIELNQKMNQTLEEIGQAIFKHWFVHFEFPNEEGKPYKSSGGEIVDSDLGELPKDWEVGKFSDLVDNIKNALKPGTHLKDRKYVPIDCLSMKKLNILEFQDPSKAKSSLIAFERGDILLGAMRVYFHRVNLAPFAGITRTTTFVLRPKKEFYLSYSIFLLNQDTSIEYANSHSKGTTMPYAVWDNSLADMPIIIPSEKILREYNIILNSLLKKINQSIFENNNLKNVRDFILPKLMSGKIRVK